MSDHRLKVVYLTPGAGGMYCGSCMHDNTLARALTRRAVDVQLVPLYAPIRTDEENVSQQRIFFGGVTVYLEQHVPLLRSMPEVLDRVLNSRWLLRWLAARPGQLSAKEMGELTLSMLRGTEGNQRREVLRLAEWLARHERPQLINLSNMLIAGCVPELKRELGVPVLVALQGDDVFLESLVEPYRQRALEVIRQLVPHIDGFLVNSNYYREFMEQYFGIERQRMHIVPLGIDTTDFMSLADPAEKRSGDRPWAVGYLARIAPEKGLHVLVDAFIHLARSVRERPVELHIAGWLGEQHRRYFHEQLDRLRDAGLRHAVHYAGEVDRRGKLSFLSGLDVLSVPSIYREPKGLYVLEALAAGVPVVQPRHGAFPELLARLGGGVLVEPGDPLALAEAIERLLRDDTERRRLGQLGRQRVLQLANADVMAEAVLDVYRQYVPA